MTHDTRVRAVDVSVIITAYNAARTIATAIESVFAQQRASVEVLVCDDASTDRTGAILDGIHDSRLRVYRNADNLGPGPSRNILMAAARGEYLAFMDADDAIAPHRLEKLLQVARIHPEALVFDDILECHDLGTALKPFRRVHGERQFGGVRGNGSRRVSLEQLLAAPRLLVKPMLPAKAVISKRLLQTTHRYGEDGLFLWRALVKGMPAYYIPEATYLYRVTPGSLSSNPRRHALVADCLRMLAIEPGASARVAQMAATRAAEFEALAELRRDGPPTLGRILRFFAGNPHRIRKWVWSFIKLQRYGFARWWAGAPRR